MLRQAHIYIKGEVIGVGFRAWTKIQTKTVKVTGWVRNNFENEHLFGKGGGVEALFQGEQEDVERMIERVKEGPAVSRVDDVEAYWQEPKEIFETFEIRK
jgi:acylphosphatase